MHTLSFRPDPPTRRLVDSFSRHRIKGRAPVASSVGLLSEAIEQQLHSGSAILVGLPRLKQQSATECRAMKQLSLTGPSGADLLIHRSHPIVEGDVLLLLFTDVQNRCCGPGDLVLDYPEAQALSL
ncbi:hypothetical protein M427DRAFT_435037 [Gonapodya prolifera JEL478]|uniref:Uncharacterized protein n=1 Tax=Gonapodya prolifera (strain JEL478) TaxID=1344416 RepID=A0A139A4V2_GONPJ|nr:hypothetical protein M427DRAFT_435037 [Gonapodya prolifera JEL478]|eukprot:KXS11525.1 hypothetical protein M427DRAFT_435037 [Gonapodya prolifera JEL478]